jgi:hypothetical protein
MAFSGIFYKKVFTKQTGITTVCVCLVCTLLIGAVYLPNHNGYVKKIPNADDVESVELSGAYITDLGSSLLGSTLSRYGFDVDIDETIEIKDTENIKKMIALHQKLIDNNTIEASQNYSNISVFDLIFNSDYYDYNSDGSYDCRIVYNLKSGQKMTRTYSVESKYVRSEFIDAVKNEEAIKQLSPFNIADDNLLFASVYTFYYDDDYDEYNYDTEKLISADEYIKIKDCYVQELLNFSDRDFINCIDVLSTLGFSYYGSYDSTDSSNVCEITVYSLDDNATDEIKNLVAKMSPAAIQKAYNNWTNDELNTYVTPTTIYVNSSQVKTIEMLKEINIDIS